MTRRDQTILRHLFTAVERKIEPMFAWIRSPRAMFTWLNTSASCWNTVQGTAWQKQTKKRLNIFPSLLRLILLVTVSMLLSAASATGSGATVFSSGPDASHRLIPLLSPTPTSSPAFTPVPSPTPAPSPTPQPVQFLPPTLEAQIATLEAHDRFFYHGNTHLSEIALTFDDGPNPANTPQILAILRRYHVRATFFDLGSLVQLYPDLARQEIADGNVIGNHTWSHPYLPSLSPGSIRKQISDTSDMIQKVTGTRPIFFRPPYGAPPFGSTNTNVLAIANSFGLTAVLWSVDPRDWSIPGVSAIAARVLASADDGAIILFHDGGGNRFQTIAALPIILDNLLARHYQCVTLAQLVADFHGKQALTPPPPFS